MDQSQTPTSPASLTDGLLDHHRLLDPHDPELREAYLALLQAVMPADLSFGLDELKGDIYALMALRPTSFTDDDRGAGIELEALFAYSRHQERSHDLLLIIRRYEDQRPDVVRAYVSKDGMTIDLSASLDRTNITLYRRDFQDYFTWRVGNLMTTITVAMVRDQLAAGPTDR